MIKWIMLCAAIACFGAYLYIDSITADVSDWCSPWDQKYGSCD